MSLQTKRLESEKILIQKQLDNLGKSIKTRSISTAGKRILEDNDNDDRTIILKELRMLKMEYLSCGQDAAFLDEIRALEREIISIDDETSVSMQRYEMSSTQRYNLPQSVVDKRRELEELSLQKEILIATQELDLLKQDLQQPTIPELSTTPPTPSQKFKLFFYSSTITPPQPLLTISLFSNQTSLNILKTSTIPASLNLDLPPNPVRIFIGYRRVGWSVLDLYYGGKVHQGNWIIPIYDYPIVFDKSSFQMARKKASGSLKVGIWDGEGEGEFVVKPLENLDLLTT
jgi:hypothetical protein